MNEQFGPWRLGRRIAVGDHADVSEAVRGLVGPTVAVKRLHTHSARDAALRALFARECAVTCDLPPHPGVIRGLEAGEDDGQPWLALSLAAGGDLRKRLDAGATYAADEAVSLACALLDALDHLHRHDVVHGDVNPSNVLLHAPLTLSRASEREPEPNGVVLCDLGVTRAPGDAGPVRGTHAYMAPEQARGEPWTPATDVFAAAVILWELLAGERLFKRAAHWLTLAAVVEDAAPPLRDRELDAIVQRALAKDPRARTPSAAVLASELRLARHE